MMSCINRAVSHTCPPRSAVPRLQIHLPFTFLCALGRDMERKEFFSFDSMGEVLVCGSLMQFNGEAVFAMFCVALRDDCSHRGTAGESLFLGR